MTELAPELKEWLEHYNFLAGEWRRKGFVLTVEKAREGMATLTRQLLPEGPEVARVRDYRVVEEGRDIPVRVYNPAPDNQLPVLIYLHGGGHMTGSVTIYDPICRKIARATNRIVIAVEYRLAPEHPYPAGLNDAQAVVERHRELLDELQFVYRPQLALAGDSAGGAMAATLAHRLQDTQGTAIEAIFLIYPGLDYTLSQPSTEQLGRGFLLEKERISWYFDQYLQNGEDRYGVSPLFLRVAEGFPRTCIIAAGYCPLRDEAQRYCQKLKDSGVTTEYHLFGDMIHAFLNMEKLVPESCRRVYTLMAGFLG